MATYGQFETLGPLTAAIGGGWKLYHYTVGTTTLKDMWSDREKATTVAQPLVADSNGVMSFYADGLYDLYAYDSNDVLKYTWEKAFYGSLESTNHAEGAALSSASTLILGSDGDYFHVTGTTQIDFIQGTQPFVFLTFDSALTLNHSSSLVLRGAVSHPTIAGETIIFVNDGSNVFREVDNAVPMKYSNNSWTGTNTFGGVVTLNSSAAFNSTATIGTPAAPTQLANKALVEKRAVDSTAFSNGAFQVTVSANAMTIELWTQAGSTPTSEDVVSVAFRTSTNNSSLNVRTVASATTLVISEGSSLGFSTSQRSRIYIVALDNSGTVELGAYHPLSGTTHLPLDESTLYSSTAEGGAGGADSAQVIYSTTARTSVPIAVLGYVDIQTGSTAGNWSNGPDALQVITPSTPRSGSVIQRLLSSDTAYASGTTTTPLDNSIPQSGEGTQFMSQAITPKHAADLLFITHVGSYATSAQVHATIALFQDSTANALAAVPLYLADTDAATTGALIYQMQAATTSATTFKIRCGGSSASTIGFNGRSSARLYGGVCYSALSVMEIFL